MKTRAVMILMLMIMASSDVNSDPKGNWQSFPIYNQVPLEIKLGAYSDGANPDLLAMVLWNDGVNNRLTATRIPPPYNGTGLTWTAVDSSPTIFALGGVCTEGMNVIVPYIKDFNLEVARFNGSNWTTSTVPGTTTNNFDNADCALTQDGIFLGTHDLTDGNSELYRSTNGGSSYTFYGRYTSSGPFDGAIREPLAASYGGRYVMGLNQQINGQIRVTRTSTAGSTPSFTHTPIENLNPPNGFTFVKEGAGVFNGFGVTFTYNSEGTARSVEVPESNPSNTIERNLGNINNNGSQFTFQGGTTTTFFDFDGNPALTKTLWGDYWQYEPQAIDAPVFDDNSYPLNSVGGPVSTCQVHLEGNYTNNTRLIVGGSRVGSDGTDLHIRDVNVDSIFVDGFEAGDTTAWFATCP